MMFAIPFNLRSRADVNIAILGPTGAGKTSFINLASGSDLRVGHSLESATDCIQLSKPFRLGSHRVTLIDTPGFDDTHKSDADVLAIIADFLASRYQKKEKLHGIIYLHRISDNRMGSVALRSFRMFEQLCGAEALANCVIALNMWNQVSQDVRAARVNELCTSEDFFKPAIDARAQVFPHNGTVDSAHAILRHLAQTRPKPLLIQREVVDLGRRLRDTSAGITLLGDLAARESRQLAQLQDLRREIEEAIAENDDDGLHELEIAQSKVMEIRDRFAGEQRKIRGDIRCDNSAERSKAFEHTISLSLIVKVFTRRQGRRT